jgi:hypothetical protein
MPTYQGQKNRYNPWQIRGAARNRHQKLWKFRFEEPSSNVATTSGMGSNMPKGMGRGIAVMMALMIFMGVGLMLDS